MQNSALAQSKLTQTVKSFQSLALISSKSERKKLLLYLGGKSKEQASQTFEA
jgi:hypothetical protein